MGATPDKGYKRSWKSLLINKRYQLRFTLFMVGVSTLLMLGLGYWVLSEASDATTVARNKIEDRQCEPPVGTEKSAAPTERPAAAPSTETPAAPPSAETPAAPAEKPAAAPAETPAAAPAETPAAPDAEAPAIPAATEPATPATGEPAVERAKAEGAAGEVEGRPQRKIQVELGEMKLDPSVMENEAAPAPVLTPMDLARCRKEKDTQLTELQTGYARIKIVLFSVGVLLVLGLTIFGIKMTHKVAGPLYKVTLYFEKMRKGIYDQVYSLRKGDQLMEFYEHFKEAHAGLQSMERADIDVLRDVIAAADKAGVGARSPELAALLDEMRETLARKEKSLA